MDFCSNNCIFFDVYVGYVSVSISATIFGNIVRLMGHKKEQLGSRFKKPHFKLSLVRRKLIYV